MLDNETSTEVDSDGLTKKQKEMSRARNPMNGNMLSEFSMDDKGANATPQAKPAGVTTDPNRSKVRTASNQQQQPVVQIQKTLGSFSTRLQAKANQFLSGASGAQATGIGSGSVEFDPKALQGGGAYVAKDGVGRTDTSSIEQDKLAQLGQLRDTAKDFYITDANGKTRAPRNFTDTLQKFADADGDGIISDEEQQMLSMSTEISTKLQQLEALGGRDSAEARALRAELQMYDQNGMVSGILQAKRQYEEVFGGGKDKYGNKGEGLKYYGDAGDEGVSITDLLALDEDRVKQEVGKAVKSASGLFGGDFESNLTKKIDRDTASYKASQQERANVLNEFTNAAEVYVGDYESKFQAQASSFASAFRNGASEFANNPNISPNAKEWFANIADKPDKDVAAAMLQVLQGKDTGLGVEERKLLASYIGDLPGIDIDEKDVKLSAMLGDLAKRGTFMITDKDGNKVEYKPKVEDLAAITRIMYDKNLNEEQKNAALLDAVDDSLNDATVFDEDHKRIEAFLASGQVEKGIKAFTSNVESSLVTFDGSRTDQLFDKVASTNPRLDGETGEAYVARIGQEVLRLKTDFENNVKGQAKTFAEVLEKTQGEIDKGAQGIAAALGVTPEDVMDEKKLSAAVDKFQKDKFEAAVSEGMLKLQKDLDNTQSSRVLATTMVKRSTEARELLQHLAENELLQGYRTKADPNILMKASSLEDYFFRSYRPEANGVWTDKLKNDSFLKESIAHSISLMHPDRVAQMKSVIANRGYMGLNDAMFDTNPKLKGGAVSNAAAGVLSVFDDIGPDLKNKGPMYKMLRSKLAPAQRAMLDKFIADPKSMVPKQTFKTGGTGWTAVGNGWRSDMGQAEQLVDFNQAMSAIITDPKNLRLAYQDSFTPLAESFHEQGRQLMQAAAGVRSAAADMLTQRERVALLVKQSQTSTFSQLDVIKAARERLAGGLDFGGQVLSEKDTSVQMGQANAIGASKIQSADPTAFAKVHASVRKATGERTSTSVGKFNRTGSIVDTLRG